MGYILTEESRSLLETVKDFCSKEVRETCKQYDVSGDIPLDTFRKAREMQLHLIDIPEKYGGMGLDLVTCAAIVEEMAYADGGFSCTMTSPSFAFKPVEKAGTPEQIGMFMDVLNSGGWAAFALTEPNSGSDAASIRTTAVRDGGDYVINGSKCFITSGGIASIYVVFALTDKTKGVKGISAFIVPRDTPGLSTGKHEDKMGLRTCDTCDVILQDVRVPATNLLGREGDGFKLAMQSLDMGRLFCAAQALGIARRALDEAVAYAKTRVTFGRPIIKHQGLQFMLAEMDMKVEAARQMMVHSLRLAGQCLPFGREAAIAKCFASDVAMEVTTKAVQVFGGYGYSREYPVEKLMRDAKIYQIFDGTNEIQKVVIGGYLCK